MSISRGEKGVKKCLKSLVYTGGFQSCWNCHGPTETMSKLSLYTRDAAMKAASMEQLFLPARPTTTAFIVLIAGLDQPRMPLGARNYWLSNCPRRNQGRPGSHKIDVALQRPRHAPHRRRGITDSPNRRVNARRRNHGLFHELDYFTNSIISLTPPYRPPLWIRHIHRSGGLLRLAREPRE